MSNNTIYIAAAGSGKTTLILNQVFAKLTDGNLEKKIGIITYTRKNQENIKARILKKFQYIPSSIQLMGWYSFLLDYWIRPFKGDVLPELYDRHVGMYFTDHPSGLRKGNNGTYYRTYKKGELWKKYFIKNKCDLFSDKLSEFAMECFNLNKNELINRISNIFDVIYVDEAQDLSGWDFDIIKILAKSQKIDVILCGDPRQNTYSTNFGIKNEAYNGSPDSYAKNCINTSAHQYINIDYKTLQASHRCCEGICNFSNNLMLSLPKTYACECEKCRKQRSQYSHKQGMFLLSSSMEQSYIDSCKPISLIWDIRFKRSVKTKEYFNYAESKGLEFDTVLIYPTKMVLDYLAGKQTLNNLSLRKLYVAITRARYSCAIVVPDGFDNTNCHLDFWSK